MKKQPKDKTPQPQKANETSFKPGNKEAEKWTLETAKSFFEQALEISKEVITLADVAIELDVYYDNFDYLIGKFPVLTIYKKRMLKNIENNTYKGAIEGKYVPSIAIFGLKNNHGWTDKQEIDHTTKGESINRPIIKFFDNDESDDD